MKRLLERLWRDENGATITSELIFLSAILVIGLIPGIAALRNAIVLELSDLAHAIGRLDHDHDDDDDNGPPGRPPGVPPGPPDGVPPGPPDGRPVRRGHNHHHHSGYFRIVVCSDAAQPEGSP